MYYINDVIIPEKVRINLIKKLTKHKKEHIESGIYWDSEKRAKIICSEIKHYKEPIYTNNFQITIPHKRNKKANTYIIYINKETNTIKDICHISENKCNLLESINSLIAEMEGLHSESAISSVINYGVGGAIGNVIEKGLSSKITRQFDDLLDLIKKSVELFHIKGYDGFDRILGRQFDETVNRAIHQCRMKENSKNHCILDNFFTSINTILSRLILTYTGALMKHKKVRGISSFVELTRSKVTDPSLNELRQSLKNIEVKYMKILNNRELENYISFGKLTRSRPTAEFKIKKIKELDQVVSKALLRRVRIGARFNDNE
jgi:hypothetical protein